MLTKTPPPKAPHPTCDVLHKDAGLLSSGLTDLQLLFSHIKSLSVFKMNPDPPSQTSTVHSKRQLPAACDLNQLLFFVSCSRKWEGGEGEKREKEVSS